MSMVIERLGGWVNDRFSPTTQQAQDRLEQQASLLAACQSRETLEKDLVRSLIFDHRVGRMETVGMMVLLGVATCAGNNDLARNVAIGGILINGGPIFWSLNWRYARRKDLLEKAISLKSS